MIFIGGVQPKTIRLEKQPRACPTCSHFSVYLKRRDNYISFFFIPLIRIKKGVAFLTCENCGTLPTPGKSSFNHVQDTPSQNCGFCGKQVETDFAYCPYCGKTL